MASSDQPNQPGSASSSQPNPTGSRSERARKIWDDLTEFLLADDNHLEMFKCGICDNIMMDATVVTKCQHGFCANCIHPYIFDHGIHECPRCPTELGDNPSQYLRHDALTTDLIELLVEYHGGPEDPEAPDTPPLPTPEPSTQDSDAANGDSSA